jgi:hypothetical protein
MSNPEATNQEELWRVRLPDGQVHTVSIDQLVDAFEGGRIDGNVMVMSNTMTQWQRLADAAGLDSPAPSATPAPVSIASPGPISYAPNSVAPVALPLDLDDRPLTLQSKKKGILIGVGIGVVVLGFVGFALSNVVSAVDVTPPPAAAANNALGTPTAPVTPPPPKATAETAATATATVDSRLNDDQKKKLDDLDKKNAAASAARKSKRAEQMAGQTSHSHNAKAPPVYMSGGSSSKYDPLNSKL